MPAWNLFVKGLEGKTLNFVMENKPDELTVTDLKKLIETRTGLPPDEQRLIFDGKQMEDKKCFSNYCLGPNCTVFLVMRLVGGAKRPSPPCVRKIHESVPRSDEACMISMSESKNVKMPCSHVISPDTLIDFCWNEICVNKKTEVRCCLCNSLWDTNTIQKYGGATDKELRILQECVSHNTIMNDPNTAECPGCGSFCERKRKTDKCVVCPICSKNLKSPYNFCWDCKKKWIGNPLNKKCGNESCNAEDILEKVKNCPEVEIQYLKGLKAPSYRLCPKCGSLAEHAGRCKHVQCKAGSCKVKFCFVCLRIFSQDSSSCGNYDNPCYVAPRQTVVPHQ